MKLNENRLYSSQEDAHSIIHSEFQFYAHDMNLKKFTYKDKAGTVHYYELLFKLLDKNKIGHRLYKFEL